MAYCLLNRDCMSSKVVICLVVLGLSFCGDGSQMDFTDIEQNKIINSANSDLIGIVTSPPEIFTECVTGGVKISWNPIETDGYFEIERSFNGVASTDYMFVGVADPDEQEFIFYGMSFVGGSYYRVRAAVVDVDNPDNSQYSEYTRSANPIVCQ